MGFSFLKPLDSQHSTMNLRPTYILILSQLSLFINAENTVKLKSVTASLYTKWHETPILLEASEFFYDENPTLFWKFIQHVGLHVHSGTSIRSDKDQYDLAMELGEMLLSPVRQNFLTFALALRYYSARVEMYRQILDSENVTRECADVVVDFGNGMRACGLEELQGSLVEFRKQKSSIRPLLMSIDHHFSPPRPTDTTIVVYGNLLQPSFYHAHAFLTTQPDIHYVFRHYLPSHPHNTRVRLPGYGVEMAIKSTEYKAQDDSKIQDGAGAADLSADDDLDADIEGFDFGMLKNRLPLKKNQLEQFKSYLLHSSDTELTALKAWQFQDMSYQAAEKVLKVARAHGGSATDALKTLRDLSQNFPTQAPTLLRIPVQDDVKGEIERNREFFAHYLNLEQGASAFLINGVSYETDLLDAFTLFDSLREENKLLERLHDLGIRGADLSAVLEMDFRPAGNAKYGVDFRHPAVNFINDLEKDARYAEWSASVRDLVRHTFPPTLLKSIRKNFYNLIYIFDPSQPEKNGEILRMMESFYVHKLPIRMGVVFVTNQDTAVNGNGDLSVAVYNAFKYVEAKKSAYGALSYLSDLYQKLSTVEKLTPDAVVAHFAGKYPKESVDMVFGEKSPYEDGRHDGRAFVDKLNLGDVPVALMNGVPLDRSKLNMEDFENEVLMEIVNVYSILQRDVSSGELTDFSDVVTHVMGKPHVVPRLNPQILSPGVYNLLEFGGKSLDAMNYTFGAFDQLMPADRTATMAAASFYLVKHDDEGPYPVTFWVAGDPETSAGRDLFYTAVKLSKSSNSVRVSFIYNPTNTGIDGSQHLITKAIQVAMETQTVNMARNYVTKLLKEENVAELLAGTKTLQDFEVNGMDMTAFNAGIKDLSLDFLKIHSAYAQQQLSLKPGESGVVANGFIIGPVGSDFGADDFQLLEKFTGTYGATKLSTELNRLHVFTSAEQISDVVMMTSAVLSGLGNTEEAKKRLKVLYSETEHSVVSIDARNPDRPAFDVTFIVDPLSKEAQKVTPLLMVLHETLNCRIRVFFNCRDKLSELPLKSFYRLIIESKLTFATNGSIAPSYAVARFATLPHAALLTMNLQPPDNWLTEAKYAVYDLDNIRLNDVDGRGVHGEFELQNLLLEGSAKDQSTDQPPRGTQFILGTPKNPAVVDTIVMANLGYFQFKAGPGAWIMRLRDGRSRDIYNFAATEGTEKDGSDAEQVRAVVSSFSTKMLTITVKKRPGMEREDVLSEAAAAVDKKPGTGILDSISSYWSGGEDEATVVTPEDDVINIFSLASGHLYERFLRLMMLSVVKNTKTPVKFWFLKNYLSPQFKEFLPYMAGHYGFKFELVEYKWPRWLHRQSEKQRLIWGYKILFLDVLFPLSVKKIIFVDADQIVRADMKELRDLDLQGAPYGYTPFCDSRTEMEGFRFWKSGYWSTHLGHRKYHISALYVVDLVKFRKIAAGDRLRAQYQGLSQDPNSLSNLDQDLPNNMIFQVPIKSLPQEWLWCETWCDEQSKTWAKTIDLCNNPLTKEPKLTSAMRIIPEWKGYDDEIRVLLDRFLAEKGGTVAVEPVVESVEAEEEENEIPIHEQGHEHVEL